MVTQLSTPNDLPYFEDRLKETDTRRIDWLVGYNALAAWLDVTPRAARSLIAESDIPVEVVQPLNGGNSKNTHTFIVLISKLEEWKRKKEEKQQPVLLPIAPETKEEREVNLLKRMLKRQDEMEATMKALWDDIRALRSALGV